MEFKVGDEDVAVIRGDKSVESDWRIIEGLHQDDRGRDVFTLSKANLTKELTTEELNLAAQTLQTNGASAQKTLFASPEVTAQLAAMEPTVIRKP